MNSKSLSLLVPTCFMVSGCLSPEPSGLAPATPADTTVKMDFLHRPLPEIPLPNDLATRFDESSPTGRRLNASMMAPTELEIVSPVLPEMEIWPVKVMSPVTMTARLLPITFCKPSNVSKSQILVVFTIPSRRDKRASAIDMELTVSVCMRAWRILHKHSQDCAFCVPSPQD